MRFHIARITAAGALVTATLAAAPAANAATVQSTGDNVRFEAAPGEINDLHVTPVGRDRVRIEDLRAPIATAGPCEPGGANAAICAIAESARVVLDLGDGDDAATVDSGRLDLAQPIEVHGGEGNDTLTGGAGPQLLYGEGDDDDLDGGPGLDLAGYEGGASLSADLTSGTAGFDFAVDTYKNIEGIVRTGGGTNDLRGTRAADRFDLDGPTDLETLAGNDRVELSGQGRSALDLGPGNDVLDVGSSRPVGRASCGPGRDVVWNSAGIVLGRDCELWRTDMNHISVELPLRAGRGIRFRCDNTTRSDPCRINVAIRDASTGRVVSRITGRISERSSVRVRPALSPGTRRRLAAGLSVRLDVTVSGRGSRTARSSKTRFATTLTR